MSLRSMMARSSHEVRMQLEAAAAQRRAASGEATSVPAPAGVESVPAHAAANGNGAAHVDSNGSGNGHAPSGLALIEPVPLPVAGDAFGASPRIRPPAPAMRSVQSFGATRSTPFNSAAEIDDLVTTGLSGAEVQDLAASLPKEELHAMAESVAASLGLEAGYGTGPTLGEAIESPEGGRLVFLDGADPASLDGPAPERLSADLRDVTLFAAAPGEGQSHLLNALLAEMTLCRASDLHIDEGQAPAFRIGNLVQRLHHDPLTKMQVLTLLRVLLKPEHYAEIEARSRRLEEELNAAGTDIMAELDVMYEDKRTATRYRCNIATADGAYTLSIRALPKDIIPLRELGLPSCTKEIIRISHGLVVVAGATGAGKSTTLASMLADYGEQAYEKIITLDDPIEYRYTDHTRYRSTFVQRQIGKDTFTYSTGVKAALRQDPDVIVVAETRDTETLSALLEAAQTGHLCFTTIHAGSAADAIRRMIEMFDAEKRGNVAAQLGGVLRQVYFQVACPRPNGGVVRLFEAVPVTDAVAANVSSQQFNELDDSCRRAALECDGVTLEQSVRTAVHSGSVEARIAMTYLSADERAGMAGTMGRL